MAPNVNLKNPYKTRTGGCTCTVFVPYDCNNHCPFCVNKKEYADTSTFSVDKIINSIKIINDITPNCDFVFVLLNKVYNFITWYIFLNWKSCIYINIM